MGSEKDYLTIIAEISTITGVSAWALVASLLAIGNNNSKKKARHRAVFYKKTIVKSYIGLIRLMANDVTHDLNRSNLVASKRSVSYIKSLSH